MPRKIIYFDRETIKNMLQERNRGTKIKTTGVEGEANVAVTAKAEASSSIYLGVPFFARVKFLITGTLQSQFLLKYDSSTTITSTEISDFESIQKDFVEFKDKQVFDIENSSTFFRVAGGYLKIVKGGVDGVDTKEFKTVMDSYDGYDTYAVDEKRYVRFNNAAFVTGYKLATSGCFFVAIVFCGYHVKLIGYFGLLVRVQMAVGFHGGLHSFMSQAFCYQKRRTAHVNQ